MIIDTSNAPCGPGFLPGLRLSEGRFAISRRVSPSAAGAVAGRVRPGLRPPKSRPLGRPPPAASSRRKPPLHAAPGLRPRRAPFGRGCRWTPRGTPQQPASRRARAGGGDPARRGGGRSAARGGVAPRTAVSPPTAATSPYSLRLRPQIRRDYPLNLSILLSGGKETNQDSLSSGERRGKSPAPNPRPTGGRGKCGVRKTACPASIGGLSPSDRGSARGRCEAGNGPRRAGVRSSRSRVVWECSPKRVVNSI